MKERKREKQAKRNMKMRSNKNQERVNKNIKIFKFNNILEEYDSVVLIYANMKVAVYLCNNTN